MFDMLRGLVKLIAVVAASAAFLGCGDDPPSDTFVACGGDVGGGWDFTAARAIAGGDGCPEMTTAGGFLFFQPTGRYSMNADVKAWMRSPGSGCGFMAVYGGFYRVEGRKICFGDSRAQGTAIPCDGAPLSAEHGFAEYCVTGDRLVLRSENLLGLTFLGELELKRMP